MNSEEIEDRIEKYNELCMYTFHIIRHVDKVLQEGDVEIDCTLWDYVFNLERYDENDPELDIHLNPTFEMCTTDKPRFVVTLTDAMEVDTMDDVHTYWIPVTYFDQLPDTETIIKDFST
jgi:hypothetical protein